MNILLIMGIAMGAGLLMSRAARAVKLPNVTAFLVAGLVIGPCVGGIITKEQAASMGVISDAALGFIAYSIGAEFKLSYLKKIGKAPLTITAFQGLTTALCVDAGLIALSAAFPQLGITVPMALLLGAIALATAPAATLMVVRQYKADGPVTRMLLPVVAMDDALGLMVFSVSASVAEGMLGGEMTAGSMVVTPLLEIVGSVALGAALGFVLAFCARFFASRGNKLALSIACVLAGVGLCDMWGLSSLLVCMMIGAVMVNLSQQREVLMEQCDRFTPPLFLLFFVLSGADLDLGVLPSVGVIGVLYLLLRFIGKWGGTLLGSLCVHADENIR
ncbi:MAG: cation:proton antiporter, partial [Clostridia bacterium]|nr:cation:proton antiporter [Clostridia bacterium]